MNEQADALLGLILVAAFALVFVFIGNAIRSTSTRRRNCSPHRWSTHPETNKLECTLCGFVAGSHETDHGDYGQ